jgi:hypothetical protein
VRSAGRPSTTSAAHRAPSTGPTGSAKPHQKTALGRSTTTARTAPGAAPAPHEPARDDLHDTDEQEEHEERDRGRETGRLERSLAVGREAPDRRDTAPGRAARDRGGDEDAEPETVEPERGGGGAEEPGVPSRRQGRGGAVPRGGGHGGMVDPGASVRREQRTGGGFATSTASRASRRRRPISATFAVSSTWTHDSALSGNAQTSGARQLLASAGPGGCPCALTARGRRSVRSTDPLGDFPGTPLMPHEETESRRSPRCSRHSPLCAPTPHGKSRIARRPLPPQRTMPQRSTRPATRDSQGGRSSYRPGRRTPQVRSRPAVKHLPRRLTGRRSVSGRPRALAALPSAVAAVGRRGRAGKCRRSGAQSCCRDQCSGDDSTSN